MSVSIYHSKIHLFLPFLKASNVFDQQLPMQITAVFKFRHNHEYFSFVMSKLRTGQDFNTKLHNKFINFMLYTLLIKKYNYQMFHT